MEAELEADLRLDAPSTHPLGAPSSGCAEWAGEAMWALAAAENIVRAQLDQEMAALVTSGELREASGPSGEGERGGR